jgi:malonyl CoA-acyl carrier protein transacylase
MRWCARPQRRALGGNRAEDGRRRHHQVVECGPGKVLMGLTKRIDGNLVGDAIYDQATLERVLSELK